MEDANCVLKLDITNCDIKLITKSGIYKLGIAKCDLKIK